MIDTHAHIDFAPLHQETDAVMRRAMDAGVSAIINVGANLKTSQNSIDLTQRYENVFASIGVHPDDIIELEDQNNRDLLEEMVQQPKVKAMGEIGLDYYHKAPGASKDLQKRYFIYQLRLANKHHLPIIIHSRDSAENTLEIIEREKPERAVMHCFAYNMTIAERFLNLSDAYMISFTGVVTFPNAKETQQVARDIPIERLMIETDCPFLAPQVHRAQTNEPAYVVEVAKKIAELRSIPMKEVEQTTDHNARSFFAL